LSKKNNLKKTSFRHLLDIFLLHQKDDLKKITFNHLLIFCAVWIVEGINVEITFSFL